jgi:hypothetical protein
MKAMVSVPAVPCARIFEKANAQHKQSNTSDLKMGGDSFFIGAGCMLRNKTRFCLACLPSTKVGGGEQAGIIFLERLYSMHLSWNAPARHRIYSGIGPDGFKR